VKNLHGRAFFAISLFCPFVRYDRTRHSIVGTSSPSRHFLEAVSVNPKRAGLFGSNPCRVRGHVQRCNPLVAVDAVAARVSDKGIISLPGIMTVSPGASVCAVMRFDITREVKTIRGMTHKRMPSLKPRIGMEYAPSFIAHLFSLGWF